MLTREMKLNHYGIDREREKWIREQIKLEENKKLLEFAAEQSREEIADILVESLVDEKGYDGMTLRGYYVPVNRRGFYAYKRLTMYIFWLLLKGRELEQGAG